MIWFLLTNVALAEDCSPIGDRLDAAWSAFNDAELAEAKAELQAANQELSCQDEVVNTEQLLGLFRLDALVSVTQDDQKGAVYATIRSVTVDPLADPPTDLGPALADLFETWAGRLGSSTVDVRVVDGGDVWVDGRLVRYDTPLEVVEGEHLVQRKKGGSLRSEVLEITSDLSLQTGTPLPDGAELPMPDPVTVEPDDPEEPEEDPIPPARKRPAALWGTGLAVGVAGGAALAAGFGMEQRFQAATFDDASYGGCDVGDDCYLDERERVIRTQANQVRLTYGAGYGLVGVGAVLTATGLVGLPVSTDGATVSVHLRW